VILVDVNLLLYASIPGYREYEPARTWLDEQLSGSGSVGFPWPTLLGYLRVATHPRLFTPQIAMATAWQRVLGWLSADVAWIPEPTDKHAAVLGGLLALPGIQGNLVPDADLAALAIEHGLTLCSTDGDFARFPGLLWTNPIAA
jgi:toxin-antitoxin system PIN domain toxin